MTKKLLKSPLLLEVAISYASNWRAFNSANTVKEFALDQIFPKGFTFDPGDLDSIVAAGAKTIRVYFGYPASEVAPGPLLDKPMKIMLVGVDANGKDMIDPEAENCGIYDFAIPCPPTCDVDSPLYGGA